MGALRTGKDAYRATQLGRRGLRKCDLQPLVAQQAHAGSAMLPAAPITPSQGSRPNQERMQQHADLARLGRGAALPLTLVAERARAATANTGCIHHSQTSVSFLTPLLDSKRLPCWTPERPIRLKRKVLSREPASFPRGSTGRWTIPGCRSRGGRTCGSLRACRRESESKIGRAQGSRLQVMPQLQTQVPHPLAHDTP